MTTRPTSGARVSRAGAPLALLLIGLLGTTLPAQGQVAWEGPLMVGPNSPAGWGLYLTDPSPGRGIGVMTTWRRSAAPGTGYRLGLAEGREDKLAAYGGIDVSDYLLRESEDFPMDMLWIAGGGVGVGDNILLSFPVGVSVGRDFQADDVWFNPYFTPRVVLDAWFGDDRPDRSLRLGFVADLGVDISFDPGWAVRFAGTIGERDAVAIGISFRAF